MPQEIQALAGAADRRGCHSLFGLAAAGQLKPSSQSHQSAARRSGASAKLGHLLSFFLISSTLFARGRFAPLNLFAVLFLLAVASELLQMFVPGRSSNLADVSVDMIGVLLGWALVSSLRRFSFR